MTALINFTRLLACVLFCPNAHASGVVSVTMSPPRVVCKHFEFWHASNVNCVFRRKEDIDVEQHQARLLFPFPAPQTTGRMETTGGNLGTGELSSIFSFLSVLYSCCLFFRVRLVKATKFKARHKLTGCGIDPPSHNDLVSARARAQGFVAHADEDDGEEGEDEARGGPDMP